MNYIQSTRWSNSLTRKELLSTCTVDTSVNRPRKYKVCVFSSRHIRWAERGVGPPCNNSIVNTNHRTIHCGSLSQYINSPLHNNLCTSTAKYPPSHCRSKGQTGPCSRPTHHVHRCSERLDQRSSGVPLSCQAMPLPHLLA